MKIRITICFILSIVLVTSSFAQDPKWLVKLKSIRPLLSTQNEVEAVVGKMGKVFLSKDDWYYYLAEYKTKDGLWIVTYSNGKCSESKKEGYNVNKGVVLKVHFILEEYFKFSLLNLDKDKFEKYQESDTSNVFYSDYSEGISYMKGGSDVLGAINIFPSNKYSELDCSKINYK
jgi:hypothetical protein